jgi:hypothetical protein
MIYRTNIKQVIEEAVAGIPNAAAGLWKALKKYSHGLDPTSAIYRELMVIIDSLYGPKIPAEEFKIPEQEYMGKSTMQAPDWQYGYA